MPGQRLLRERLHVEHGSTSAHRARPTRAANVAITVVAGILGYVADKRSYVVRSGDYLTKIAALLGFQAADVWNDPANAELKKQRPNPELLLPGDILVIPEPKPAPVPVTGGTSNDYQADPPKVHITLLFGTPDATGKAEEPLANEAYVIVGLGDDKTQGTTDGEGRVEFDVPIHVREVSIEFPKRGYRCPVGIGDLDPHDEPSGVRQRLQNLGYHLPSDVDEARAAEEMRSALQAFQRASGLGVSGELDDATRDALLHTHGI